MRPFLSHGVFYPTLRLALAGVVVVAFLTGCTPRTHAQPQRPEAIGFVRLALTDSSVTLLEVSSVPGRLKKPRRPPDTQALSFDVLQDDGEVMWTESLDDPLRVRVEYVDDDGNLRTSFEERAYAEVTLRIPVTAPHQTLNLYRTAASGKQADRALVASIPITF